MTTDDKSGQVHFAISRGYGRGGTSFYFSGSAQYVTAHIHTCGGRCGGTTGICFSGSAKDAITHRHTCSGQCGGTLTKIDLQSRLPLLLTSKIRGWVGSLSDDTHTLEVGSVAAKFSSWLSTVRGNTQSHLKWAMWWQLS